MTIEEIKQYIKDNGLDTRSRKRPQVYQRAFLSAYLYNNGMTLEDVARLFKRHHSTIIHCVSLHNDLSSYKDELYLDLTARLNRKAESREKLQDEDSTLRYRIMNAHTKPEFRRIQDLVKNNLI